MPSPTTARAPSGRSMRSERMPQTFWPPMSTSLGHLRVTRDGSGATSAMAEDTAMPASSDSQPQCWNSGRGLSSIDNEMDAPRGETHWRSSRPRPAVCSMATSATPSPSPARARCPRSALVDPVVSTTSTLEKGVPGSRRVRIRAASGS